MKIHPLFQYLSTFSKEEFADFEKFLQPGYFNRSKPVLRLHKVLKKFHPNYEHKKFSIEKIGEKLAVNGLYSEKTIQNLLTEMARLAEKFMSIKEMEKNEVDNNMLLIKALRRRDVFTPFKKMIQKKYGLITSSIPIE